MDSPPTNSSQKSFNISTGKDSEDFLEDDEVDSPTKDELIDQMQEKFGQMLIENQRFNEVKSQNEVLKSTIQSMETKFNSERNDFELRIASLQKQNEILSEKNNDLMNRISELEAENIELKNQMNALRSRMQEERQKSTEDFEAQKLRKSNSYAANLAIKNQQINELKSIIQNLTDESSSMDSQVKKERIQFKQLQEEYDRVQSENKKQQKQLRILSGEIMKLHSTNEDKDKEIRNLNEENNELVHQLQQANENNQVQQELVSKIRGELQNEKNHISQLTSILPFNGNVEDYAESLKSLLDQKNQFQNDLTSATSQLKKAANAIRKNQDSINALSHDVESERLKNVHLQKVIDDHESKNEKLITQIKALSQTRASSSVLTKAFGYLCRQIDQLYETLDGKKASLRPLITTFILLKRWQLILGTQQFYVSDQRNWWWLESSMYHSNPYDKVLDKIKEAAKTRNQVLEENEELRQLLRQASASISEAEKVISEYTDQNNVLQKKLSSYDAISDKLNEQLDGLEYIDVIKLKEECESYQDKINSMKTEMEKMEKEKAKIMDECNLQGKKASDEVALRKKFQKECDLLRGEVNALIQRIQLMEVNQKRKESDMLALERKLRVQKNIAQDAVSQGFVITKENRKLSEKVVKQKRELKQYKEREKEEKEKEGKIK